MSKRKKEIKKEYLIMIISFLTGSIMMLLLITQTSLLSKSILKETVIYEKNSLYPAIQKIENAVYYVESYRNEQKESSGTAFVYKKDSKYGYLMTNEHVINNSNKVVLTSIKEEKMEAEILGKDEYLDLAVLRIDKKYVKQVAILGNSEKENIGNTVFTVGSPLGSNFIGSVTSGILSGKNRYVKTSLNSTSSSEVLMQVLQVDASINPGNSGGPLLNGKGEVIGICTLKLVKDDIEGMGFAIPIEYAKSHIETLEKGQTIKWPKLGISMANINDTSTLLRNNISLNLELEEGVVVTENKSDSDLKKGDIIIKVNNKKTPNTATLRYEIYKYKSGDKIEITYIRNEKEKKTKVTLS